MLVLRSLPLYFRIRKIQELLSGELGVKGVSKRQCLTTGQSREPDGPFSYTSRCNIEIWAVDEVFRIKAENVLSQKYKINGYKAKMQMPSTV